MTRPRSSVDSLTEATRNRAKFSGHGNAKGTAGLVPEVEAAPDEFLKKPGELAIVNPQEHGFQPIKIGMAWDNVTSKGEKRSLVKKLAGKVSAMVNEGVDLDLGCLYELQTGERGAIQAFGERFGKFDQKPYITLSGDERTGDAPGEDEYLVINGHKWPDIKRVTLYAYIYDGTPDWSVVSPEIRVRVPGEPAITIQPKVSDSKLAICAIATLENVRNGIKVANHTEFYAGHAELDRAFGYGISWVDGEKS
jgi:tellurite resistance protein TerA